MDLRVPVACRFVQDDHDLLQEQDLSRIVGRPDRLLADLAGLDPAAVPPLADELPVQVPGMLADNEECFAASDPIEQLRGAEVAVGDPQIAWPDQCEDLISERTLLAWPSSHGMTSTTSLSSGSRTTKDWPGKGGWKA